MAASTESVRVQLSFASLDSTLWGRLRQLKTTTFWFMVEFNAVKTIDALLFHIIDKFGLPIHTDSSQFMLDGCLLPKWETSRILRDKDLLCITYDQADCPQWFKNIHCLVDKKQDFSTDNTQLPTTCPEDLLNKQAEIKKKTKKRHHASDLTSIADEDVNIQLQTDSNETSAVRKQKTKRRRHSTSITDEDIKIHLQADSHEKRKKKHKHKKVKVDVIEPESLEIDPTNEIGNNSSNKIVSVRKLKKSVHKEFSDVEPSEDDIPYISCSKSFESNRTSEQEIKDIISAQDTQVNIAYELSQSSSSDTSTRMSLVHVADKNSFVDCAVNGRGTFASPDRFISAHDVALPSMGHLNVLPRSSAAVEVSDVVDNPVSLNNEKKTPHRKKRRTRRRKSKHAEKVSSESVATDIMNKATLAKSDQPLLDSPWPVCVTRGQPGHVIFKDDSSSDMQDEDELNARGPLVERLDADLQVVTSDSSNALSAMSGSEDPKVLPSSTEITTNSNSFCKSISEEGSSQCFAHSSVSSTAAVSFADRSPVTCGRGTQPISPSREQYSTCSSKNNYHRDSPWPTCVARAHPGHVMFKDDSNSDMQEEDGSRVGGRLVDKLNADVQAIASVGKDFSKPLLSKDSTNLLSSTSADRSPVTSSRGAESLLPSRGQYNNCVPKKNNPFANVQVFCRQKFKKMPSVSWDSHSDSLSSGRTGTLAVQNMATPRDTKQCSEASDLKKDIAVQPTIKEYEKCKKLSGFPQKGIVVAYKILQMAEDYTPHMSDFQEATVLNFDPSTKMVRLNVLSNPSRRKTPGRFDLTVEYEDEILTNADISDSTEITVAWASMCDVRLVQDAS